MNRLQYYRRILGAYVLPGNSQLTFWHETSEANPRADVHQLGEYYMLFAEKARYSGHHDAFGIPMLNYRGRIGLQYNPIAIAQWGLGNYNLLCRTQGEDHRKKFITASDWLLANLEQNSFGLWVWNHRFDWDYRVPLKAPWYSALAQAQGMSLLLRAYWETGIVAYLDGAKRAFGSFLKTPGQGGVTFTDRRGNSWFEEYIVDPPTHILNGFIWAAWGVYDYFLATQSEVACRLFEQAVETLRLNLHCYDFGFWSLYEQSESEQSGTLFPMLASPFYHRLHIVQLRVMRCITGDQIFSRFADKWEAYTHSRVKRTRALCYKSAFKLCYY